MKISAYLKSDLERALKEIREAGESGRDYSYGEIGETLTILEMLECVKTGRNEIISEGLINYTYLQDIPERI